MGEEFENASELDLKITIEDEHHDRDELEDIYSQESCEGVVEPTNVEFDDMIFFVWNMNNLIWTRQK